MQQVPPQEVVERFLSVLRHCLKVYGASLVETAASQPLAIEQRLFSVPEAPLPAMLLLHRTRRSDGLPTPEYRARVVITLPQDQIPTIARRRQEANRLSTLGALDTDGKRVFSQGLLEPTAIAPLAGVVAVALLFSGTSLLEGLQQASPRPFLDRLRGKPGRQRRPRSPSAWSDAEMERIGFDHAHLGGVLEAGIWRLVLAGSELSLTPVDDDPLFGGGLLLHLRMPQETFVFGQRRVTADELNTQASFESEAPSFGSWSEDAGGYSFQSFAPNSLEPVPFFDEHFLGWGLQWLETARFLAAQYPILAARG